MGADHHFECAHTRVHAYVHEDTTGTHTRTYYDSLNHTNTHLPDPVPLVSYFARISTVLRIFRILGRNLNCCLRPNERVSDSVHPYRSTLCICFMVCIHACACANVCMSSAQAFGRFGNAHIQFECTRMTGLLREEQKELDALFRT
jgi:hypothetical protein